MFVLKAGHSTQMCTMIFKVTLFNFNSNNSEVFGTFLCNDATKIYHTL